MNKSYCTVNRMFYPLRDCCSSPLIYVRKEYLHKYKGLSCSVCLKLIIFLKRKTGFFHLEKNEQKK